MPPSSLSTSQSFLEKLPLAEMIDDPGIECTLRAKEYHHSRSAEPIYHDQGASIVRDIELPKELLCQFPNLHFHSAVGDSLRYHSFGQNPDEPFFSVLFSPIRSSADQSMAEEGFSDLPDLESDISSVHDGLKTDSDHGFENLPVLNKQEKTEAVDGYPTPAHEAEMVGSIGTILGVSLRSLQSTERFETVVCEFKNGTRLLKAFQNTDNPGEKLQLIRGLIDLAKKCHSRGYALEGASIDDFVVSEGNVWLRNLTAIIPLAGSPVCPSEIAGRIAPEMIGSQGPRTLGGILYGLGIQFLCLATESSIDSMPVEEPSSWLSQVANPTPELSRLLGSLLAKDPEYRLGIYQEIGADETWTRLDQMVTDWIESVRRPVIMAAGGTTIGIYRENNEDSFGIVSATKRGLGHGRHVLLGMVSDGMGGGAVGEIASTLAIESLVRSFNRATEIYPDIGITCLKPVPDGGYTDSGIPSIDPEVHAKAMSDALIIAHYEVKEAADKGGESCGGMGATAVAVHISEWNAVIGHVGDSRAYLLRDKKIRQITTDHSAVQKLVNMGLISRSEAESHSRRHELSQAIGGYEEVVPDVANLTLISGDSLLLCSDGITNVLREDKILELMDHPTTPPQTIVNRILAEVNLMGAPDNATVLVVQIR